MAAGNITNYQTSLGCSTQGLSIGCPVGGADGWYSDGTNSYYVSNGSVQSVNTDPCYVAPPPPPPPPAPLYYDYVRCTGLNAYVSPQFSVSISGNPPNSVTISGNCYALIDGTSYETANYPVRTYTGTNCNCN